MPDFTIETEGPLILEPEYEIVGSSVGTFEDNNAEHGENPELENESDV